MAGKQIKKILIFGLPRTKTTALQIQLSREFNLTSLSEPYTDYGLCGDQNPYEWSQRQDCCVVKLLTTHLINYRGLRFEDIWKSGWDRLVVTSRSSFIDAALSLYYAARISQVYHYRSADTVPVRQFDIDLDWVHHYWIPEMRMWNQTKKQIQSMGIEYDTIDYELYVTGAIQKVAEKEFVVNGIDAPFIDTRLDYKSLCKNYSQVVDIFENITDILC